MSTEIPTALAPITVLAEQTVGRLLEAMSVLEAIDAGGLLDKLPCAAQAARNQQCAISMLAVLRRDLRALTCELQSACLDHDVMARLVRSGSVEE